MILLSLPVAGDSHLRNVTHMNQIVDNDRSLASLSTLSKSMRIQSINNLGSKFCRSVERTALKEPEDSGGAPRRNDEGGNMPEELPEEDIDNQDENDQEREGGQGNDGGDEGEGGNNEQVPGNGDEGSDSDSDNDLNYDGDNETEDSASSDDEENDNDEEDEDVVHQPAPQANIEQIERYIGLPHNNRNRRREAPYDLPDIVVNKRRSRYSTDTDSSTEARRKRKRRCSSAYDINEQIKRRRDDDDDNNRPPTPRPRFVPVNF